MTKIFSSKKWLTMLCLAAALSLTTTACGDDDDDATDNNTPGADAGNDADETPDDEDGNTDDEDGKTDDEEDGNTDEGFTCDDGVESGFDVAETLVTDYFGFWVTGRSSLDEPYNQLELNLGGDEYLTGETYPIDGVTGCENCVQIWTECVGDMGDCSGTIYGAGSGTLLINEHDETTGVFKVTVQEAEFVEITADGDIVEDGAGWCIESAVLEGNYLD